MIWDNCFAFTVTRQYRDAVRKHVLNTRKGRLTVCACIVEFAESLILGWKIRGRVSQQVIKRSPDDKIRRVKKKTKNFKEISIYKITRKLKAT